jgi:FkbM family methyltransferase
MSAIDEVLREPVFAAAPPVLVDVGASGGVHAAWKELAKYSICIAFDPDEREMAGTRRASRGYKDFHVFNRALTAGAEGLSDFYLTKSPPCSSLLAPNAEKLAAWEFADRFRVLKKSAVETIRLATALAESRVERVDWFKTDSQGTDLRLFLSLGSSLIRRVLVAEFEPGIMDAYEGEDKLWKLMQCMDEEGFWMSEMTIKGSTRMRKDAARGLRGFERNYMVHMLKNSPGWGEVTYLNAFAGDGFGKRDYLLGWVCATLQRQHGFALELAEMGQRKFRDAVFEELRRNTIYAIRRSYFHLPSYLPLVGRAIRKWEKLRLAKRAAAQT